MRESGAGGVTEGGRKNGQSLPRKTLEISGRAQGPQGSTRRIGNSRCVVGEGGGGSVVCLCGWED
jgi:hypothetical protein